MGKGRGVWTYGERGRALPFLKCCNEENKMANLDEGQWMSENANKITSTSITINLTPEELKNRAKCLAEYIKFQLATLYLNGFPPYKVAELLRLADLLTEDGAGDLKEEAFDMETIQQRESMLFYIEGMRKVQEDTLHTLALIAGALENMNTPVSASEQSTYSIGEFLEARGHSVQQAYNSESSLTSRMKGELPDKSRFTMEELLTAYLTILGEQLQEN